MAEARTWGEQARVALEDTISTMKRQMSSDAATDATFNEDMAKSIARCLRVLGRDDEADGWYRPRRTQSGTQGG
jgi:hypothetical protein